MAKNAGSYPSLKYEVSFNTTYPSRFTTERKPGNNSQSHRLAMTFQKNAASRKP